LDRICAAAKTDCFKKSEEAGYFLPAAMPDESQNRNAAA
jgi:hypothetical protein